METGAEIVNLGPFQIVVGLLTLICAALTVLNRNPIISALGLMGTLFTTGGLYFGLGFYFVGAVQILVYAGAIAVLFVFIVMLLDLKPLKLLIPGRSFAITLSAAAGLFLLMALILAVAIPSATLSGENSVIVGGDLITHETAFAISNRMLSRYMFAFQMTGVLILAAIMGAVILGKPRKHQGAQS